MSQVPGTYGTFDQPQHQGYGQPPSDSPYLSRPAGVYGTPHGYYPGVPQGGTNGWAVAAFVLALVGIGIFAVVAGHVAMSQITRTREGGRGFALAGLVLGYLEVLFWIVIVLVLLGRVNTGA